MHCFEKRKPETATSQNFGGSIERDPEASDCGGTAQVVRALAGSIQEFLACYHSEVRTAFDRRAAFGRSDDRIQGSLLGQSARDASKHAEVFMPYFRCATPECGFEGELPAIAPEVVDIAKCPVCGRLAVRPTPDDPHYRCRRCGSLAQFGRDVGPTAVCGAGLPFDACEGTSDRLPF